MFSILPRECLSGGGATDLGHTAPHAAHVCHPRVRRRHINTHTHTQRTQTLSLTHAEIFSQNISHKHLYDRPLPFIINQKLALDII